LVGPSPIETDKTAFSIFAKNTRSLIFCKDRKRLFLRIFMHSFDKKTFSPQKAGFARFLRWRRNNARSCAAELFFPRAARRGDLSF